MRIEPSPPDPHLHLLDTKAMATPSPRSSNPAHRPVSTPTTPTAAASSSFGCMGPPVTDSPPDTPRDVRNKPAPAVMSATAFLAFLSPRRLMQRAARAFRTSKSRRRMKFDSRDEPALPPVSSRFSDAVSGGSLDVEHGSSDGNNNTAAVDQMKQQEENIDPVPEKIIHEMNHQRRPTVVKDVETCEKTAADENKNGAAEEEDEPKKAGAVPATEEVIADNVDMTDKFCMVVKEAMMKKHEEDKADDTKEQAMMRFQGSKVKTAMEARAESERPRRREVARSNDVIEEACTKLLTKRQGSRVRALVGAFETVMDAKPAVDVAGKPKHQYCNSV